MTIQQYLKKIGFDTVDMSFYSQIEQWQQWYQGKVKKFHNYEAYNGKQKVMCERLSLQMAKKVCEDWANLLMNEKVTITIEGDREQQFIDTVLENNNFIVKSNESQEYKAAYGTVAYVPYMQNVEVLQNTGEVIGANIKDIHINYVTGDFIFPLSWENGKIKECAFGAVKVIEGKEYFYLQMHTLEHNDYVITNLLFDNTNGQMLEIENINSVKGFENVAKRIVTKTNKPQFVIDRMNIVNNINKNNPMGIAVFANSIDVLKAIDIVFDSYNNEFILGRKRIMVAEEALQIENSKMIFDPTDMAFYRLPEGINDDNFIKEIDMSLRANEHEIALQNRLNLLSAKCGFGENHYKFEQGSITTATQIISENSSLFRTLKKHEIILECAIRELVQILLWLGNQYLNLSLNEKAEVAIDFDDSIIEDRQTELTDMRLDVSAGLLKPELYIMKKYKVDEQTAKNMMAEQNEVTEVY
ncbi:MAG: phage portal protein [Firmicutes bacterium]|jgi:A118 family predicted phage portal protein|nr:phage portal protein [Bacillota bacterium]